MMSKTIYLFFFLFVVNVSAQTEKKSLCKEIYGKWETYYIQLPFGIDPIDKSEIWVFEEDGTLTINNEKQTYRLEENCTKLFIGTDPNFFAIIMYKNTLFITKTVLLHESYVLRFKKNN